nr:hypothetical protein [Lachnospiraceae bacterium]
MALDSLKKKVSDYTTDKKNIDEEDDLLSRDEARLSDVIDHSANLDTDVMDNLSGIGRDYQTERDRIEGKKEALNEVKEELTDEIGGELKKVGEAKGKINSIARNKYAVGSDSAIKKCEDFIGQLKEMADQIGSSVSGDAASSLGVDF